MHIDEAKQKWCPQARFVIDEEGYAAGNRFRHGYEDSECMCIVDKCMLWEWDSVDKSAIDSRGSGTIRVYHCTVKSQTHGSCGLIGRV